MEGWNACDAEFLVLVHTIQTIMKSKQKPKFVKISFIEEK